MVFQTCPPLLKDQDTHLEGNGFVVESDWL